MIPETEVQKCVCNSIAFHEINKYSHSLNCVVKYLQCESCGLIIALGSKNYDLSKIYNNEYFTSVDYGWKGRAKKLVKYIKYLNISIPLKKMQICDFGAGNGYLSKLLIDSGFNVLAYEPYIRNHSYLERLYYRDKPFNADVLLMVEVFEHFTNAFEEIEKILSDFQNPKLIIFTTVLTDDADDFINNWSYLNPDAGHFTLWSKKSLELFGEMKGYKLISLDTFLHILCKTSDMNLYNNLKILSIPPMLIVMMKKILKRGFK